MKKLALALAAVAAIIFGTGLSANAYPPGAGVTTSGPATVAPGGAVTVTGSCLPGETVTATLGAKTASAVCGAAGTSPAGLSALASSAGGYKIVIAAPTTEGVYTGKIVGSVTGTLGTFQVTVKIAAPPVTQGGSTNGGGTLPSTGSDGTNTALMIGIGSLVVGLGLFGTARLRRNQDLAAGSIG